MKSGSSEEVPVSGRRQVLALMGTATVLAGCGPGDSGADSASADAAAAPDIQARSAPQTFARDVLPAEDAGGIAVLRTIALGQVGPMITSIDPVDRNEDGSYNRRDTLALFLTRDLEWTWTFADKQHPASYPQCRLMIDGEPATGWIRTRGDGEYTFKARTSNGWHIAYVVARNLEVVCIASPFLVNDTGKPLDGPATPWTSTTRFEFQRSVANAAAQVRYGTRLPVARPLKVRPIQPYRDLPQKSDLWVRKLQQNIHGELTRRWVLAPTGDIVIEVDQKYFHSTATVKYPVQGKAIATWPARSGPRGQSSLLYVCDIRIRGGPASRFPLYANGAYFLETNGRLGLVAEDGRVITELGLEIQGLAVHAGVKHTTYMHRATHPEHAAQYDEKFVEVADWSQVKGPVGLWEPWGFEVLYRGADGEVHDRDGHEFWVTDTLHHRIVFADHWTAHRQSAFEPAHFPPPWYKQAPRATGRTAVANFVGSLDGKPTQFCNEPWQIKYNRFDGKLYWTNFAGNSICRCDLHGANVETVISCALQPSNTDLQLRHQPIRRVPVLQRLSQSRVDPIELRKQWLRDGRAGRASCVRPTALGFDSEGNLMWIEHYTYAVRRMNLRTRQVETVCTVLDENGGSESSGNNEPNMVIDYTGSCGPIDDIFVWSWSNSSDRRFDRYGVSRVKPWSASWTQPGGQMFNGPMNLCAGPNYGWGMDVYGGRMIAVGSAGGAQFLEITRRQPTDPVPDYAAWKRGRDGWNKAGLPQLLLGPGVGQGELGLPNYEEMSTWSDGVLHAYLREQMGVAAAQVADVAYAIRWGAVDLDG